MDKKKILVVEDEYDMRTLLTLQLETSGYEVFVAADGQEGLDEVKNIQPDLVILDLMLPRIGGYEVCAFLKSDERYNQIPVLMLTARAADVDRYMGLQCGADEYMFKPFEGDILLEKVGQLLDKGSSARFN